MGCSGLKLLFALVLQVRSGALPQDVSQSNYFTTVDPLSSSPIPDGAGGGGVPEPPSFCTHPANQAVCRQGCIVSRLH